MEVKTDLYEFLHGYLVCALWSSNDESTPEGGEPLDSNYGIEDIAPETIEKCRSDCEDFMEANAADLKAYCAKKGEHPEYSSMECAGHDFWLTRNGHGTGYWDRGLGDLGDRLADAARVYSSVDLYVGDDGKVHQG